MAPSRGLTQYCLAQSQTRQRSRLIFLHWAVEQWATLMQYPTLVTQLGSARGIFPPCYGRALPWLVCIAQRTRRTAPKEHAVLRCVRGLLPLSWKSQLMGEKALRFSLTVPNPHQVSKMSSLWRIEQSSVREFGKPDS